MPRGKPKRGEFDFIIWFQDGTRLEWKSNRPQTDADIAAAIRRYLFPIVERIEAAQARSVAVDPVVQRGQEGPTRDPESSSNSTRVPPQEAK